MNELSDIPDFLGVAARVDSVASLLQGGQLQLQNLRYLMIVNRQTPADYVPAGTDRGSITYQQHFDALESGMRALMDENQDIVRELIAEAVIRRGQHMQ